MLDTTVSPDQIRTHYQSLHVAVVIPGLQALGTGISLGIVGTALGWSVQADSPWVWGLLTASISQAAAWLIMLGAWHRVVYILETSTGADLNQDGYIGQPRDPIRVEVVQDDGRRVDIVDLPATQEQLIALGAGLLNGLSFGESNWTGRGRPFSKREFSLVRDTMLKRGLVRWINDHARAQGMELTGPGRAVMRRFAAMSASPTLNLNRQ